MVTTINSNEEEIPAEHLDIDKYWLDNCDWKPEDTKDLNLLIPMFLTSSFLYYHLGHLCPIVSNKTFDMCCHRLLERWEEVDHPHKGLIDIDSLRAGTAFYLKLEDYPSRVRNVALSMSYKRPLKWIDVIPS